jgi:hypothetical protein
MATEQFAVAADQCGDAAAGAQRNFAHAGRLRAAEITAAARPWSS